MTKTLADMTADERQSCVGMWCETEGHGRLLVLARVEKDGVHAQATVPQGPYPCTAPLSHFTPRFDLPPAWNPDGTPPKGEWVDGHMWWNEPGDDSQTVDLIGAECLGTGEMQGMDKWPKNVTPAVSDEDIQVRRFITEWENTND
ncbi:hypothetical protein CDES_07645 [Corynebacterium deserti GIMN1.010]|uniref:Uncharacterized protein n=1 Tax=Corynebacterium deserti GIMN1.010 TaxID=931089 RepID=A0A0M4CJI7_9CORY|nr:hypothetical protein [Corynebacterium deserti]ALC05938.1 hypothetical protein CDES_07645 [Corynebacterium deserti GIMN1.010]